MKRAYRKRIRYGCDRCKVDSPTQGFQGALGSELWLCGACFDALSHWTKTQIKQAQETRAKGVTHE